MGDCAIFSSPNHQAFVAWTVHLQHDGEMLAFLLDICEVPEVCLSGIRCNGELTIWQSHTGVTLARATHAMAVEYSLEDKVSLRSVFTHLSSIVHELYLHLTHLGSYWL